MYNRFVVSKATFSTINSRLWHKLWKWAKRRHPKKPKEWIKRKYFTTTGRKWAFKDEIGNTVMNMASIPIVRYVMIKKDMRVHANDNETKEYWQKRVYTNALNQVYSIKVEKLIKTQKGICPSCGNPITGEDIAEKKVHAHHMLPRSKGGSEKLNNLRLLHQNCHVLVHQALTRDEMASWMKKKLNYVSKASIVYFQNHPTGVSINADDNEKTGDGKGQAVEIEKATKTDKGRKCVLSSQSTKRAMERKRIASAKRASVMLQEGRV